MELQKKVLQTCGVIVAGAVLLRLLSGAPGDMIVDLFGHPKVATILLAIGTGRFLPGGAQVSHNAQSVPNEPQKEALHPFCFSVGDAQKVSIRNTSGYSVDTASLLEKPLTWDLAGETPTVLILHTHATESYTKTEDYTETSRYRTLDCGYNTVSIGDRLAELLEAGGIRVIHDRTLHDYPSYDNSYSYARQTIEKHLQENPGIVLVIDLHRDAMEDSSGRQLSTTVTTSLGKSAQLMMVVGSDAGGIPHSNWGENMALAAKLHTVLEKNNPGICRPINLRSQRFNQDLSTGAMLIEVGTAGNTRQEALIAAEHLAAAILALSDGSTFV